MSFGIVTDSTCDWDAHEYQARKVQMVPLSIKIDDDIVLDVAQISAEEFYDRMQAAKHLPMSSQPTPAAFDAAYQALEQGGCDQIISIHIAGVLSGTVNAASLAAAHADVPVSVVDAKTTTAGLGLLVQRLCDLRDAGATAEEALAETGALIPQNRFYLAVDNLENLLKGGRLSEDQAMQATLLNIKPELTFDERGALEAYGKGKGMKGVVKDFAKAVQERTEQTGRQRVRFLSTRNEEAVESLKEALAQAGVDYVDCGTCKCGATIATHVGIGAVGLACIPERVAVAGA